MSERQTFTLDDNLGVMFSALLNNENDIYEKLATLFSCMQDVEIIKGQRGRFLRIGMMCHYLLYEFTVDYMDPKSYYILDPIPDGFTPAVSINRLAITGNAQLTESLVVVADRVSGNMKLLNMASNAMQDVKLLNSTYDYIIAKDAKTFENPDQYDPNALQWDELPEALNPGYTYNPRPEWKELDDEGWG